MKDKAAQEPERRLRYIVIYLLVAVGLAGVILMAVSKPEQRGVYSSNPFAYGVANKFLIPAWIDKHEANRRAVHAIVQSEQRIGIGVLGDSISEAWEEKSKGITMGKYAGVYQIWSKHFNPENKYRLHPTHDSRTHEKWHESPEYSEFSGSSINLAVSGDWAEHLLWRLQDGEMPADLNVAVWLIMIGVNNLLSGKPPGQVAERVQDLVDYVLAQSSGLIVLQAVLPTCFPYSESATSTGGQPNATLLNECISRGGIKETNELNNRLEAIAHSANKEYCTKFVCPFGFRILWLDCTRNFRISSSDGSASFDTEKFQPDVLHLNSLGYSTWAKCLQRAIEEVD